MKRSLYFITLLLPILVNSQNKSVNITFQVESSVLTSNDSIFIAGNHEKLGVWQPGAVKFKHITENLWEIKIDLPVGYYLEYKFTRGTWATEAANKDGMPLMNSYLEIKNDTVIKHILKYWGDGEEIQVQGQITGHVDYYRQMKGEGILDRDVIVWLPPDYDENQDKRYPVLYMHDGQNIIDPHTSSFKVDWGVDETADSLIKAWEIESLIIVGMNSTNDRNSDYSPGIKGEAYMKFVAFKVKPMIDSIYRTKPGRDNTTIAGASMGGLISFMLHWNYNDVFGKAICMSSAFQYADFDYIAEIKKDSTRKELKAYIDNGDIGLDMELQPGNDAMLNALEEKGYKPGSDYYWVKASNARHFERDWGIRMVEVFKLFFPK